MFVEKLRMVTNYLDKYKNNESLVTFSNLLLVLYFFSLPWKGPTSTIFFILMILFFVRGNVIEYLKIALKNHVVLAMFLYFCVSLLWVRELSDLKPTFVLMKPLLYPIVFFTLINKEYIYSMFTAFILGMLVSEITSYGIYFQLIEPIFYNTYKDPSPFMQHTQYGLLLAYTFGLLLYRYFNEHEKINKFFIILFVITITINIFFNTGRTGYTFYGLSIVIVMLSLQKHIFKVIAASLLSLILLFSIAYELSPNFQKRIHNTMTEINNIGTDQVFYSSMGARWGYIYYSANVIRENLLFGVGPLKQVESIDKEIKKDVSAKNFPYQLHLHNEHLTSFVQFGLIGFVFYLNIYVQLFRYKQNNNFLKMNLVLIAVLVFLFAWVDSIFEPQIDLIFSALIVLSLIKFEKHEKLVAKVWSKKEIIFTSAVFSILFLVQSMQ